MPKFLTNIDLQKNQILNVALQNLASAPSSPVAGQIYFDTGTTKAYVYSGSAWLSMIDTTVSATMGFTGDIADVSGTTGTTTTLTLKTVNSNTGAFGSSISVPSFTVNGKGLITAAASNPIPGFTLTGDISTVAGSVGSTITVELTNSGVAAGVYNNATSIVPLTIDAKGRVTSAGATVTIAPAWSSITSKPTTLSGFGITDAQPLDADLTAIAALSGSNGFLKTNGAGSWSVDTNTYLTAESDTLNSVTGRGATTSAAISINNTTQSSSVSSGALIVAGGAGFAKDVYIGGTLNIAGNFVVGGTLTTIGTSTLEVTDPLIYLATGNQANINDIGFVGHFNDGTYQHTGLARRATDGKWYLFSGVTYEAGATINFSSYTTDTLKANIEGGASLTGTPVAPTPAAGNNSTQIATTAFVNTAISSGISTKSTKYATSIGNGASTSILVNHALNSQDVTVTIREVASPYAVVYPDIEMTDANNITVRFATAPTSNQYRVIVVG